MKISAYSQICQIDASVENHFDQISKAASCAANHGSKLLVLPGWSLGRYAHLYGDRITEAKKQFQRISDLSGIAIVAEIDDTYFFSPGQSLKGPFIQRFAQSKDEKPKYQEFAYEWNAGKRFVSLDGKTIGLLLCGENNYIFNKQSEGNYPSLRYPDLGWTDSYYILVNPTHRLMGNWGKLHKRFEYLSQGGRTVVHVANDDSKRDSPAPSSLCIYRNGQCIVMGDFANYDPDFTVQESDWWLATVDTEIK